MTTGQSSQTSTKPTAPPRPQGELTMARRLQLLRQNTELTGPSRRHTTRTAAMSSMGGLAVRRTLRTREPQPMRREPNRTTSPNQAITASAGDSDRERTRHPDTSSAGLEGFAVQDADSVATNRHVSYPEVPSWREVSRRASCISRTPG